MEEITLEKFEYPATNVHVWVLAPFLELKEHNLWEYYDYTQSIAEYHKVFAEIGCEWQWVNLTIDKIDEVLAGISNDPTTKTKIVINLCDGDELNDIPGITVIDELERLNLIYTGSDRPFYDITTSKITMKEVFDRHSIPTPSWKSLAKGQHDFDVLKATVGEVMIIKPAVSAGSMGIGLRNIVSKQSELTGILVELEEGYRGWNLTEGGVIAEEFIKGREFTVLIVGSYTDPETLHVYPPVERVFHESLPEKEQFLSYERLWETDDDENPVPGKGTLYAYQQPDTEIIKGLEEISINAYTAMGGMGYGRLDIRMDKATGKLYVLEVNAQCGLSDDENYTSIGAILRFAKKSFTSLMIEIMQDGIKRYGAKHKAR